MLACHAQAGVDAAGAQAAGDVGADVAGGGAVVEGIAGGFGAADCVALGLGRWVRGGDVWGSGRGRLTA